MSGALWALFVLSVALPVYVYIGYPVAAIVLARLRPARSVRPDGPWPSVTVAIAAHNEERDIARVVKSALEQAYPGPPIEVLVGLDGCTDRTREVLASLGLPRISWLDLPRSGKAATDNRLVEGATGDIVVTTAAGAVYDPDALRRLCEPFRDPVVGCTTGRFAPRQDGSAAAAGEGLYWRLEYALMAAESTLGILACASGTSMAHRRSIFRPIPLDSDGDVSIAPNAVERGHRTVFVPRAVVRDDGPGDLGAVLRNRRRMALRALPTTVTFVRRLARAGRGGPAFGLLSHKLLRWLVPFCLPAWLLAAAGLVMIGDEVAVLVTAGLLIAAGLVAVATLAGGADLRGTVWGFALAQLAFALATVDAVRGRRARMWSRDSG